MNFEPIGPQLTQTFDAWLVEVPARFGRRQRYRFLVESQARRFLSLFTRWEINARAISRRATSR
jgi:hypothetical protein